MAGFKTHHAPAGAKKQRDLIFPLEPQGDLAKGSQLHAGLLLSGAGYGDFCLPTKITRERRCEHLANIHTTYPTTHNMLKRFIYLMKSLKGIYPCRTTVFPYQHTQMGADIWVYANHIHML